MMGLNLSNIRCVGWMYAVNLASEGNKASKKTGMLPMNPQNGCFFLASRRKYGTLGWYEKQFYQNK